MANQCNVVVLEEVSVKRPDNWQLAYQWCRYDYADKSKELGYRFIWRRPEGSLQAARGQARLPSARLIRLLMEKADQAGWGDRQSVDAGEFQ